MIEGFAIGTDYPSAAMGFPMSRISGRKPNASGLVTSWNSTCNQQISLRSDPALRNLLAT
jgi:hypothetical protein